MALVASIVKPSIFMSSICASVIAVFVPSVTPSIAPPSMSTLSAACEAMVPTVGMSLVSATVPVASGRVMVRSAVGSVTVNCVSKLSFVLPSKKTT